MVGAYPSPRPSATRGEGADRAASKSLSPCGRGRGPLRSSGRVRGASTISRTPPLALRHGGGDAEGMIRQMTRRIALLRLEQHVAADRRRHRGAAAAGLAAMLDDDGADIARLAHRRERDEERVIALLPRYVLDLAQAMLALVFADVPHLRGAGFAAHLHAGLGDARGVGGSALLVDDGVHAVEHQAEIALRDLDGREIRGLAAAVGGHDAG